MEDLLLLLLLAVALVLALLEGQQGKKWKTQSLLEWTEVVNAGVDYRTKSWASKWRAGAPSRSGSATGPWARTLQAGNAEAIGFFCSLNTL